ncbi:MAG TPA: TatD family hydrolase, partial [Candidatus Paceibacterota bacterium]|nr:TatD family hydrolase [Candidatus Paceibacterota bacterium]
MGSAHRGVRLFDTHAHPQFARFDDDRHEMLHRASAVGIHMICVGVDLESSRAAIALAQAYPGVYASVGLHPNDNLLERYDQSGYEELSVHPKVVAIGEIGLDYYRTAEPRLQDAQRERFVQQLALVKSTGKPAIIHCRSAHHDMRTLLDAHGIRSGVIHSFTGTWEDARFYLDIGLHIGLNGIVTFARDYDETVVNTPLNRILLETDSPYLAPNPYRGRR